MHLRTSEFMESQNIDENFSKIHHALATKLLPAVKRYAVGTEPVREAAKVCMCYALFHKLSSEPAVTSSGPHFMNKQLKYGFQHSTTILQ